MRYSLRIAMFLAVLVMMSASLLAQAPPSADTFVSSSSPHTNYGSWPLLAVQQGTNSYLRFNLSGLPSNVSVAKATLRLYVDTVSRGGSFDVFEIDSSWAESSLIYNNAPPLGSSATGGHSVAVSGSTLNQFVVIDITPLVQAWVNGSLPNNGVALSLTTSGGAFAFDSKESSYTSHEPELSITLTGPAGPQGPQGPQGPAGPAGASGPQGPQGLQGAQGVAGPMGPQGLQGVAGTNGTNGISFNFRNAFDPTASYAVNDVVTYSGSTYIAIAASQGPNNPTPDQNPSAWSLMAQAGAIGQSGAQGPAGPAGPAGPSGPQGPQGMPGQNGAPGAQGPAGPQGPQGAQGPQGPAGPAYGDNWIFFNYDAGAYNLVAIDAICGGGQIAISGSCGYDPLDPGGFSMRVVYSGPDPGNHQVWRCVVDNTDSVDHNLNYGAFCITPGQGGTLKPGNQSSQLSTGNLKR